MNKFMRSITLMLTIAFTFISISAVSAFAQKAAVAKASKGKWSIYAGWQPWPYAQQSGILKKWADKFNIKIELEKMDYVPSIENLVAKKADFCVMTNMEALDMPAASGIGVTSIITGDFSNGNDCGLGREGFETIEKWRGQNVYLVQGSVSNYLFDRRLEKAGMTEKDVTIVNTSDADIATNFINDKSQKCVVTWNPMVMQIAGVPKVSKVFCSSEFPGEILDLMVVRTDVLKANPELGKALVGAWYEVMSIMSQRGANADKALTVMADAASCDLVEYKNQLKTTAMFYTAKEAVEYTNGQEIKTNMDLVRKFCFEQKLLGENAKSADKVGIKYPDGTIQGDPKNVKLIFDNTFMKMAAEGSLN
jgi:NitT/TauT family transport system substrate-binding protein